MDRPKLNEVPSRESDSEDDSREGDSIEDDAEMEFKYKFNFVDI